MENRLNVNFSLSEAIAAPKSTSTIEYTDDGLNGDNIKVMRCWI